MFLGDMNVSKTCCVAMMAIWFFRIYYSMDSSAVLTNLCTLILQDLICVFVIVVGVWIGRSLIGVHLGLLLKVTRAAGKGKNL